MRKEKGGGKEEETEGREGGREELLAEMMRKQFVISEISIFFVSFRNSIFQGN
jgi:hypothetical protein